MTDVLQLRGLGKTYAGGKGRGETVALDNVDLTIGEGEFLSIVGASGCGKSTLLRIVAGLERQSSGELLLDGTPITRPGRDRGMVFQQYTLFPWLTALENIEFALRDSGRRERSDIAREYLEVVGLTSFAEHFPAQLSGGMQQRVAIARALALRPRILLMDEPFGALDSQTRMLMQELLLAIWERDRLSVLFVTHDVEEAIFLADRVCVMASKPGRVRELVRVEAERPRILEQQSSSQFMAARQHVRGLIHDEAVHATSGLEAVLARREPSGEGTS
ncbi:MAG: ABC transporter ATP-binding protein [Actinomycetes bacterium]